MPVQIAKWCDKIRNINATFSLDKNSLVFVISVYFVHFWSPNLLTGFEADPKTDSHFPKRYYSIQFGSSNDQNSTLEILLEIRKREMKIKRVNATSLKTLFSIYIK